MTPTNRRIRKQQLPPTVEPVDAPSDFDEIGDAPRPSIPPLPDVREFARPPKPTGRLGAIVRGALGVALVVAISSAVAWAARAHVASSARFAVTTVDVNGARHRTNDDVIREAGIQVGANIFTLDLDDARAKLLADPWLSDATIARRLPGTILVQVTEREAGAIVALGEMYLATRTGEIFKKLEAGDPADLPIVTGLKPDAVTDDREGAARMIRRAIDVAAEYEHGPLAGKATLEEVHVGDGGAIRLVVGKNAIALELGEPPFRKKLEQAARVMAELEKRSAKADTIMLDNEARPERVVVRMR